jgi:hypothetical protein
VPNYFFKLKQWLIIFQSADCSQYLPHVEEANNAEAGKNCPDKRDKTYAQMQSIHVLKRTVDVYFMRGLRYDGRS